MKLKNIYLLNSSLFFIICNPEIASRYLLNSQIHPRKKKKGIKHPRIFKKEKKLLQKLDELKQMHLAV